MAHVDAARVGRRADLGEVAVDPLQLVGVLLQLLVGLAEVERADVADREDRRDPERLGLAEDARVQVQLVVGLGLVDVTRAAARHRLE
jgi:hypothetical protein